MTDLSQMSGRWIWCGSQLFTEAQWDTLCALAASWEIQGIHPKCADGIHPYYNDAGMHMLKSVAEKHGLKIAPYHYVYGPKFGAVQIAKEAQISAHIGSLFGAVIPDIEDEYMSQYDAAISFAKQVRALYSGLWMPTMYANCTTHPTPLLTLNPYIDAWLPQVYFSVWTGIAQDAINYVFPQWHAIDQQARQQGQNGLKPTLPIISTTNNIAASQIVDFIEKMQKYGYIGFWYHGTYEPYTSAVMATTIPTLEEIPLKIDLTTPGVSNYFEQTIGNNWRCKQTGHTIGGAILDFYRQFGNAGLCGLTFAGLPTSEEVGVEGHPSIVEQTFERTILRYDPQKVVDNPPGAGSVYLTHLPVEQPPLTIPPTVQTSLIDAIHQVAGIAQDIQQVGTSLQNVLQ